MIIIMTELNAVDVSMLLTCELGIRDGALVEGNTLTSSVLERLHYDPRHCVITLHELRELIKAGKLPKDDTGTVIIVGHGNGEAGIAASSAGSQDVSSVREAGMYIAELRKRGMPVTQVVLDVCQAGRIVRAGEHLLYELHSPANMLHRIAGLEDLDILATPTSNTSGGDDGSYCVRDGVKEALAPAVRQGLLECRYQLLKTISGYNQVAILDRDSPIPHDVEPGTIIIQEKDEQFTACWQDPLTKTLKTLTVSPPESTIFKTNLQDRWGALQSAETSDDATLVEKIRLLCGCAPLKMEPESPGVATRLTTSCQGVLSRLGGSYWEKYQECKRQYLAQDGLGMAIMRRSSEDSRRYTLAYRETPGGAWESIRTPLFLDHSPSQAKQYKVKRAGLEGSRDDGQLPLAYEVDRLQKALANGYIIKPASQEVSAYATEAVDHPHQAVAFAAAAAQPSIAEGTEDTEMAHKNPGRRMIEEKYKTIGGMSESEFQIWSKAGVEIRNKWEKRIINLAEKFQESPEKVWQKIFDYASRRLEDIEEGITDKEERMCEAVRLTIEDMKHGAVYHGDFLYETTNCLPAEEYEYWRKLWRDLTPTPVSKYLLDKAVQELSPDKKDGEGRLRAWRELINECKKEPDPTIHIDKIIERVKEKRQEVLQELLGKKAPQQ